jgi:thiamine pyrophosphate-dependent acetolactate synthase large subunit-like protein
VDIVQFAEAFGAKGLSIERPDEISSTLKKALTWRVPCWSACRWTTEIITA